MVGQWTHSLCGKCWRKRFPDRGPYSATGIKPEHCCDCGTITGEGIYIRGEPTSYKHPASN